jgi:hypothetical protein
LGSASVTALNVGWAVRGLPKPTRPALDTPAQSGTMANSGARPWAVGDWLQGLGLGLGRYEADFRENAIDADILRDLTDQDLEKLGVVLGDRRRLLRAIAVLDDAPSPAKLASGPLPVTFAPASGAVTPPISAAIEVSGEGL